ncbi:MAG: aspartyl/asparaginyl beta-hydroxylase domain-containing protein [Woeseia sp.]
MKLDRSFIRLPYRFDAERMAAEVAGLPGSAWITHPAAFKGNSAVPLVSRDGGRNDDFHGAMSVTPYLEECRYLQQVMASFGEVLGRSRLMKLAAGAEVVAHVDFNYHWYTRVRIHVPVITNPAVQFHCGKDSLHMQAGECWIFNSWRRHRVVNDSEQDRVHLVIDAAGSSRFWATVRQMQCFDPVADREAIESRISDVSYEAGRSVEILTEAFNVSPVMAPGEVDALTREIIADFESHAGNDPVLVSQYRDLLQDFARDWREIWHLFGFRKEGWSRYRAAIDNVQRKLDPDNRALLTQSNEVGVNPIIVQRVLRAALAEDQWERFVSPG